MRLRLYVAGPASGLPDYNRPAFAAATLELQLAGYEVLDPLVVGADQPDWAWEHYLRRALRQMLTCHGLALLPAWAASKGAALETEVAVALRMPVATVDWWLLNHEVQVPPATVAAAKWEVLG